MIEKLTKLFLLLTLIIPPFVKMDSLFYPFTSGKAFFFRLFVLLAFLGWAILMIKDKRFRPKLNLLVIALIIYIIILFITGFFSVDAIRSFFSNFERSDGIFQFIFFVIYFLMLISVFRFKKDWKILISLFLLSALVLSAYSWLNYRNQIRLFGLFGNPAYFGAFLLIAMGFASVAIRESFVTSDRFLNNRITKSLLIFLLFFFAVTLFYTGTRGCYTGLVTAFLSMTFLALLFLRENKKLLISLVSATGVFIVLLTSIFIFADYPIVKDNIIISRIKDLREFEELSSVQERLSVWKIAIRGFKDKPVFGWGPENFGPVFNKYYDYKVGLNEPWFDKAHNQFLEVLSTGGIILFTAYLFWVFSVFYLIFRIFKQKRLLAVILASTYFGYLVQGMFLFDTLPLYLALFPFLAFVSSEYERTYKEASSFREGEGEKRDISLFSKCLIGTAVLVVISLIYTTVWLPYKANALLVDCYINIRKGSFGKANSYFEKAIQYDTPISFSNLRKQIAWDFLSVLTSIKEEYSLEDIKPSIKNFYNNIIFELEKVKEKSPYDPQIYYILGVLYEEGYKRLGIDENLVRAEDVFKQSLNYSDKRTDYYNEYAKVLMMAEKYDKAKDLVENYMKILGREDAFVFLTLGNINFVRGNYKEAMEKYEKARENGYDFWRVDSYYNRYLLTAQELGDYQKILDISLMYLKKKGEELKEDDLAKTYFNIALGYFEVGDKEKSREFFYKALDINEKVGDKEKSREFFYKALDINEKYKEYEPTFNNE